MSLLHSLLLARLNRWAHSLFGNISLKNLPSRGGSIAAKGDRGEWLAYHYLRGQGYRIVARQYRRSFGEIDLIGWEEDILCFIEVKLRTRLDHGRPEEAVNRRKKRQICRVARDYRRRYKLHDINYRYDIVSISGRLETPHFQLIRGAFCEDY
ncbi:MAG TPA: YraN family protein [Terriglobia bacterium]|nr:YraN family protein [Terriglobia bacterium]